MLHDNVFATNFPHERKLPLKKCYKKILQNILAMKITKHWMQVEEAGLRGMVTNLLPEDAAAEWLAHDNHQ